MLFHAVSVRSYDRSLVNSLRYKELEAADWQAPWQGESSRQRSNVGNNGGLKLVRRPMIHLMDSNGSMINDAEYIQ